MEAKKRGRKPKGGKLIETTDLNVKEVPVIQNIILHLKCSSKDIEKVVFNSTGVEPYTQEMCHAELNSYTEDTLHQKLKNISTRLHVNDINGRSDCFWCTCPFDNPPVYIPKSIHQGQYQVYGSFCCPECAAGFLFQQKLDQSTKFEQYHLLNDLYGSVYAYAKPIVPAPPPHYLLNKYFGSLTIREYRNAIRDDSVMIVVDKPICCTYPEMIQCSTEYMTQPKKQEYRLCRKPKVIAPSSS
jgi:hypothetical protein